MGAARALPHSTAPTLLTLLVAVFWIWLANDSRLHWDEPSLLYIGSFASAGEIVAGDYQPAGYEGFTHARLAHLMVVKAVASLFGKGPQVLHVMTALYLGLLLLGGWFLLAVLRFLLPQGAAPGMAVALVGFSPLAVYLAFKTLPEAPAWAAMTGASLALLHAGRVDAGPGLRWAASVLIAGCLLLTVWMKGHAVLLYATLALLVLAWVPRGLSRARLAAALLASGVASLAGFAIVLGLTGISIDKYLGLLDVVADEREPVASLALHALVEGGVLFAALPLAWLSRHRRETWFFVSWFLLTTLPVVLLLQSVEARYLMPNLPALAGLVWLAMDGVAARLRARRDGNAPSHAVLAADVSTHRRAPLIATLMFLLLGAQAFIAQKVMAHEIDRGALDALVEDVVTSAAPAPAPLLLASWEYSLYHYLRLRWPDLPVYSATTPERAPPAFRLTGAEGTRFFTSRAIRDREGLAAATAEGREALLISFGDALPIRNLRGIARAMLPAGLERRLEEQLAQMSSFRHEATSWIWHDPSLRKLPVATRGPYQAWRIVDARQAAVSWPSITVRPVPWKAR